MNPAKVLFIDRDGTIIHEPPDQQVDEISKISLLPNVVPALRRLQAAGFMLVLVSNQDGRGTASFPEETFREPHRFLMDLLASQGITFAHEFICPHLPADQCDCRKPRTGLLTRFLAGTNLDLAGCAVIGDRDTDLELAANLGVRGIRVDASTDWLEIAHELAMAPRRAEVMRNTNETRIRVVVDLDTGGPQIIATGIGFFDHMLEQLGRHGGFALNVDCDGDLDVDDHHSIEDVALSIGEALRQALGNKHGIGRFGFVLPMDEAQARVAIDLSGRPASVFQWTVTRESIGGLASEMIPHFFQSLAQALGAAIHIDVTGDNAHHEAEACFKGVGRALRPALARSGSDLPSTKGML